MYGDKIGQETLKIMKYASWYNNWLFSFIKPHLGNRILEVGAGVGIFTELLINYGEVTATDINKYYITNLKKKFGRNARVGFGDIENGKYFFRKRQFDTVVCLNVLEHIKYDKKALKKMYRLLVSGGRLILLVPAHQVAFGTLDKNLGHQRRYNEKSVSQRLNNAGFNLLKVRYLNLLGLIGWFVDGKVLKRKILPKNQLVIFDKLARAELLLESYFKLPFGLSVLAIGEKV